MARYNDNAPIGHTCPIIDSVIGKMESAKNEADYISKHPEEDSIEEANTILGELIDAIKEMKMLEAQIVSYGIGGNEEYNRAEEAEGERDEAIKDKEYLQEEIDELKAKIEELEYNLG